MVPYPFDIVKLINYDINFYDTQMQIVTCHKNTHPK